MKEDDLEVGYISTDPDSSAFKPAEELSDENILSKGPYTLIVTGLLSEGQRKYVEKLWIIQKVIKKVREVMQSRFSLDISNRWLNLCTRNYDRNGWFPFLLTPTHTPKPPHNVKWRNWGWGGGRGVGVGCVSICYHINYATLCWNSNI